jgi:DNA modification methylase
MRWEPERFLLETASVWNFPDRGDWATHDPKYRGNWSPYIPRNLLLRYSAEGDFVLDQFAGGGTTLIEAKLLRRNILGMDVNPAALKRCLEKTSFDFPNAGRVVLRECDARKLTDVQTESIDFICTHPPYANIIRYSTDIENDLSRLDVIPFLEAMEPVAHECFRVLKHGKFCAILIGDTRKRGHIVPLGFDVMKIFENVGFHIKEIIIKEQHNCQSTGRWKSSGERNNFLLLAHEYLFVFRKPS